MRITKLANQIWFLIKNTQYIVLKVVMRDNSFKLFVGEKMFVCRKGFNQIKKFG